MQGNQYERVSLEGKFLKGLLSHLRYSILPYFYAPVALIRRVLFSKERKNNYYKSLLLNRWGFIPPDLIKKVSGKKTIWIDALSGGEITQVVTFCKLLKKSLPDHTVILSTNNDYSMKFATKHLKELDYIFDSPWDIKWVVKRLLKKIKPDLIIFIEGAYLPILVQQARKRNIKTVLVSAIMREKWLLHNHYFYRRYFFLNPFKFIDYILVKSHLDYDCLIQLGVPAGKIHIMGNLKFDTQFLSVSKEEVNKIKNALKITDNEFVLVAGSIHPGEENLIVEAYHHLRQNNIRTRLIIAPRYNHFIPKIIDSLTFYGYSYLLRSRVLQEEVTHEKVVIVDTFGELMHFYALSSMIIVGGSFFLRNPCGFGQNIVEPLLHSKPVFFGPYMEQFREITNELLSIWNGMEIHSANELSANIMHLLENPFLYQKIVLSVSQIVLDNSDSANRHIDFITNEICRN